MPKFKSSLLQILLTAYTLPHPALTKTTCWLSWIPINNICSTGLLLQTIIFTSFLIIVYYIIPYILILLLLYCCCCCKSKLLANSKRINFCIILAQIISPIIIVFYLQLKLSFLTTNYSSNENTDTQKTNNTKNDENNNADILFTIESSGGTQRQNDNQIAPIPQNNHPNFVTQGSIPNEIRRESTIRISQYRRNVSQNIPYTKKPSRLNEGTPKDIIITEVPKSSNFDDGQSQVVDKIFNDFINDASRLRHNLEDWNIPNDEELKTNSKRKIKKPREKKQKY